MSNTFTLVDLFAGCGGLSLGLEASGFKSMLAVEKSDMAGETYFHNFIERIVPADSKSSNWTDFLSSPRDEQLGKGLLVGEVAELLADEEGLGDLKEVGVDLVAGGPPCQGFSLAGRRNPKDPRNQLPWQFMDVVEALEPKAVIMENVLGMSQNFRKHNADSPFDILKRILEQTNGGYVVQQVLLNAMHYGVPQHRPRVMLIGLRQDIAKKIGIHATKSIWKSDFKDCLTGPLPDLAPEPTVKKYECLTADHALWDICATGYAHPLSNNQYKTKHGAFAKMMREFQLGSLGIQAPTELTNHILRKHATHIVQRFGLYQTFKAEGIPSKVLNLPNELSGAALTAELDRSINGIGFPVVTPDGSTLAKDRKALYSLIRELKTKKHSQRALSGDEPAPTVVSLPDDFVHYKYPRTLTVRELARFQSFPDSFEFRAKETTGGLRRRIDVPQYTQVGNAVPPKLSEAAGKLLRDILK